MYVQCVSKHFCVSVLIAAGALLTDDGYDKNPRALLCLRESSQMGAFWQVGVSLCLVASSGTFHVEHSIHTSDCEQQGNGSKVRGVYKKLKRNARINCIVDDEL